MQLGPLAVGVSSRGLQFYSQGVFKASPNTKTDHAVLLVGYDEKIVIHAMLRPCTIQVLQNLVACEELVLQYI